MLCYSPLVGVNKILNHPFKTAHLMHPNFVCLLFVGIQGTKNTQHLDDLLTDGGCLLCLDFIQHDLKQLGISV